MPLDIRKMENQINELRFAFQKNFSSLATYHGILAKLVIFCQLFDIVYEIQLSSNLTTNSSNDLVFPIGQKHILSTLTSK